MNKYMKLHKKAMIWNERNDCGVKALAAALDISYAEAWYTFRKLGRPFREGVPFIKVIEAFKAKNYIIKIIWTYSKKDPKFQRSGKYLLSNYSHVCAYEDSHIYDVWRNWDTKPLWAWSIVKDGSSQ